MLDPLTRLEMRVGATAQITIQRPRPRDYTVTVFRDHERDALVVFVTGHGDTLRDAVENVIRDPASDLRDSRMEPLNVVELVTRAQAA